MNYLKKKILPDRTETQLNKVTGILSNVGVDGKTGYLAVEKYSLASTMRIIAVASFHKTRQEVRLIKITKLGVFVN